MWNVWIIYPVIAWVSLTAARGWLFTGPSRFRSAWPNRESPALKPPAREHVLRTLSPAECIGLLEPGGIGRVGFASADGIITLPVNFAVTGKSIIFRTAPDTLLALYADAQVSFEADRFDAALHEGWSVLVHGRAHKVTEERAVERLEDVTRSGRGHPAPATCMCASRRPVSAGAASSQAEPPPMPAWSQGLTFTVVEAQAHDPGAKQVRMSSPPRTCNAVQCSAEPGGIAPNVATRRRRVRARRLGLERTLGA